jgi:hypothetical protein
VATGAVMAACGVNDFPGSLRDFPVVHLESGPQSSPA